MSLVIPANANRHRFDADGIGSNAAVSIGEILFSAEFPAGNSSVVDIFELRGQSTQIIRVRRNSGGTIQLSFGLVNGGLQSFVDLGASGSRLNIFLRWDDTAQSDQFVINVNGTETAVQYSSDSLEKSSNLNLQIESFTSAGETLTVHDVALKLDDQFTVADRSDYLSGTSPSDFQTAPDYFVRPDGTGYPATISPLIGSIDLVHTNTTIGETDDGSSNAPYLTSPGSSATPVIVSVSSASGSDTVELAGQLTVVLSNDANVGSIRANDIELSNISLVGDGQTVTATVGLGVASNIGTSVDIVVNNGSDSAAHAVTVAIPSTHSSVVLSVDFAGISPDSRFYGATAFSGLGQNDVWIYDNLGGTLTYTSDLSSSIEPANTSAVTGSGWFLDSSDNHRADLTMTDVVHPPIAGVDSVKPVISLAGASVINLNTLDTYIEYGATAIDDQDGDITPNIVINSSSVNTAIVGSYIVTYNVSDTAGNSADQVSRTVNVQAQVNANQGVFASGIKTSCYTQINGQWSRTEQC